MLTDAEIRYTAITALTQKTDRDRQRRVGASDIADPCDYCLAHKLLGHSRETALSAKTWLGRTIGTAGGAMFEQRLEGVEGLEVEKHVWFGELGSYGKVGGSIDLLTPDEVIDWKSSTRRKSALMQDYLQSISDYRQGLEPRWTKKARGGYDLKVDSKTTTHLSDAEHALEMAKQVTKVRSYFGQVGMYQKGSGRKRGALVFWNRDGNGYFDVPDEARYEDETATHDVWVLSFNYDEALVEGLLTRATTIWERLEAGATPNDFARHQHCFSCSDEIKVQLPDMEFSFGVAA